MKKRIKTKYANLILSLIFLIGYALLITLLVIFNCNISEWVLYGLFGSTVIWAIASYTYLTLTDEESQNKERNNSKKS